MSAEAASSASGGPDLSVVIVDARPGPLRREFLDVLADDVRAGRVEVLVVSATPPALLRDAPSGVRWVPCAVDATVPAKRALGLWEASAPVVGLTESFCVPSRGWASAIIEAHADGLRTAVGGPVTRHSGSAAQWALSLVEYGRFLDPATSGSAADLPGINVAYRVERLRGMLGRIPEVVEVDVHRALREHGESLWWVPEAVMYDASSMGLKEAVRSQFHHGRLYGGGSGGGPSPQRRLARAIGCIVLPIVLFSRIFRGARRAGRVGTFIAASPPLVALLLAWSFGEGTGWLLGKGRSDTHWR